MTLKKFERIPYLDGLRAISIAAVLLGHSANSIQRLHTPASRALRILINPEVGVRVFFVISGFIITTLLLQELENTKKIDILGFYQRRIARIFPAFYTYVIVVLLLKLCGAATLTWPPLIAAATYTWNYAYFWGATTEKGKLLLEHSWTLSLEEQFYLLWPACLLFLNSKIAKYIALLSVVIIPTFRAFQIFSYPHSPRQPLMMFHTGCDQIMWGALAAFAYQDYGILKRYFDIKYKWAIPLICVITVYLVCPFLESRYRPIGLRVSPSLVCMSSAVMILWLLSGRKGLLRRVLESWLLVQIGMLSYSLYIWQQMFLVWHRISFLRFPLNLVAVFIVAFISYRFIETPMRKYIRNRFNSASAPASSQIAAEIK